MANGRDKRGSIARKGGKFDTAVSPVQLGENIIFDLLSKSLGASAKAQGSAQAKGASLLGDALSSSSATTSGGTLGVGTVLAERLARGVRKLLPDDQSASDQTTDSQQAPQEETTVKKKVGDEEITIKSKGGNVGKNIGSFNVFNTDPDANLNFGAQIIQDILSFTGTGMRRAQEFQQFGKMTEKDKVNTKLSILGLGQLSTQENAVLANTAAIDPDRAADLEDQLLKSKERLIPKDVQKSILDSLLANVEDAELPGVKNADIKKIGEKRLGSVPDFKEKLKAARAAAVGIK